MLIDLSLTPEEFSQVVLARRHEATASLQKWSTALSVLTSKLIGTEEQFENVRNHIEMVRKQLDSLVKAEQELKRLQDDIDDRI